MVGVVQRERRKIRQSVELLQVMEIAKTRKIREIRQIPQPPEIRKLPEIALRTAEPLGQAWYEAGWCRITHTHGSLSFRAALRRADGGPVPRPICRPICRPIRFR